MRLSSSSNKGFTLTEIMIVLVVLGLLIAVAAPRVTTFLTTGKESATLASMAGIAKSMKNFNADTAVWPGTIADLVEPIAQGGTCYHSRSLAQINYSAVHVKNWKGPYLDGRTMEVAVDTFGANLSIGVVDPTTFAFSGLDIDGTAVTVSDARKSRAFAEKGFVPGIYLHSRGEDTITTVDGGGDEAIADDYFVFVSQKTM